MWVGSDKLCSSLFNPACCDKPKSDKSLHQQLKVQHNAPKSQRTQKTHIKALSMTKPSLLCPASNLPALSYVHLGNLFRQRIGRPAL